MAATVSRGGVRSRSGLAGNAPVSGSCLPGGQAAMGGPVADTPVRLPRVVTGEICPTAVRASRTGVPTISRLSREDDSPPATTPAGDTDPGVGSTSLGPVPMVGVGVRHHPPRHARETGDARDIAAVAVDPALWSQRSRATNLRGPRALDGG